MVAGAAIMVAPASAETIDPSADGAPTPDSAITIVQTPSEVDVGCVPAPLGLDRRVSNDDMSFQLTVIAAAPPCTPIEAKAVVYAMPGNGEQWPQTLVEVVPFTISTAGTTEITFAKACDPVQFDVLTGATPAVISPLGEFHGPLLFPFDVSTSLQFFGNPDCIATTTTVPGGPSTTTPEVDSSTTVPESGSASTTVPEVAGVTTVPISAPPAASAALVAPGTQVLGSTQQPRELALTGSSATTGVLLGGAMAAAGAGILLAGRRRLTAEVTPDA